MRLSFAFASVCSFVCSLLVEQVLSASFQGEAARVDPRVDGAINSKSNVDDVSCFRFARFHVARLSTHDTPTSPPRVRGWHNDRFGWGGWRFGERIRPILTGIVAQPDPLQTYAESTRVTTEYPGYPHLPSWSDVIRHNASHPRRAVNGSFLPLENIQGDILFVTFTFLPISRTCPFTLPLSLFFSVGMRKPVELFYFFHINNATSFKRILGNQVIQLLTSAAVLISAPSTQPLAFMNIAFSQQGLNALGITDDLGDTFFSAGQLADAPNLGDNVDGDWDTAFKGSGIHGVLLIASDLQGNVDGMLANVLSLFRSSISEVTRLQGAARPGSKAGHERTCTLSFVCIFFCGVNPLSPLRERQRADHHADFGFLDGISDPAVAGFATTTFPGQSLVPAGTILTGRDGDTGTRPPWALDGSFLVCVFTVQFSFHVISRRVLSPTPHPHIFYSFC